LNRLGILGATGSIGRQGIDVAARHPDRLRVVVLATGSDREGLCAQAQRLQPEGVALERADDVETARAALQAAAPGARVEVGPGAAVRILERVTCEVVLNGVVGAAGLAPSLAALAAGARLALANKETLVVGGALIEAALARGGELVPVDSEHSAALQCLGGRPAQEVARMTLTASGGPLRRHPSWRDATPAEVLAHPVWSMGPRITVDSALLFNKGLELIEARWLFSLAWSQLAAVLHPQARVHALVEFIDGSVVAQAAPPDMRLPIQLALSWPERWSDDGLPRLDHPLAALEFEPIAPGRFPAFDLALAAGREGGTTPCVANAADEVAVRAFLDGAISLGQVPEVIARVLGAHASKPVESLTQLQAIDAWARDEARSQAVRV
jgi:1-deoxy-D-xylulose-5-phosphate reductoisomerase